MKFEKLKLKPAFRVTLEPFIDQRGIFERLFCQKEFKKIGLKKTIAQINLSITHKSGTVRGLHFQKPPYAETKIITCVKGKIFDCLVDLRQNSPTFLAWHGEVLSEKNRRMLVIPEGFAHGLQTLTDDCRVFYFHTNYYRASHEKRIRYDEPLIAVKWPQKVRAISAKDSQAPFLKNNFKGLKI